MNRNIFSIGRGLLLGIIAVSLLMGMLPDAKAAPYYQGKVIIFVVPMEAGGGTDIFRRFGILAPTQIHPRKSCHCGAEYARRSWPDRCELCIPTSKAGWPELVCLSGGTATANLIRPKGIAFRLEQMLPIYASPSSVVYYGKPALFKEPKDIMTAKG